MDQVLKRWKVRVAAAVASMAAEPVVFHTSLQDQHSENEPYHAHGGMRCVVIDALIDPNDSNAAGCDEEALPMFKVRFADGCELVVGDEEVFSKSPAFFELMASVCGGFSIAREAGFAGPTHMMSVVSEVAQEDFERQLRKFVVRSTAQNFNTPPEFRIVQKAGQHVIIEGEQELTVSEGLVHVLFQRGLIYPQTDMGPIWHLADGTSWPQVQAEVPAGDMRQDCLKVSLDGGATYVDAREGVRVIYGDVPMVDAGRVGELHVNLTSEGVIFDLWDGDKNAGTRGQTVEEVASALAVAS